jgi:hypothetical protein
MNSPDEFRRRQAQRAGAKQAYQKAGLANAREPFEDSWRNYLEDVGNYDRLSAKQKGVLLSSMAEWIKVVPKLRYFGFHPLWNAPCPFCPGKENYQNLWVMPAWAGEEQGWSTSACCKREGITPRSLLEAIVIAKHPDEDPS